jgi:hypothetical protein
MAPKRAVDNLCVRSLMGDSVSGLGREVCRVVLC